tara:strand:- start:6205 stop:6408 length:204 start_codon:yes stop_codon:yes gene_type:complete
MIHFNDAREVLQILRDIQSYIFMQSRSDKLAELILTRVDRILSDNDNINVGDINEDTKQAGKKDSNE